MQSVLDLSMLRSIFVGPENAATDEDAPDAATTFDALIVALVECTPDLGTTNFDGVSHRTVLHDAAHDVLQVAAALPDSYWRHPAAARFRASVAAVHTELSQVRFLKPLYEAVREKFILSVQPMPRRERPNKRGGDRSDDDPQHGAKRVKTNDTTIDIAKRRIRFSDELVEAFHIPAGGIVKRPILLPPPPRGPDGTPTSMSSPYTVGIRPLPGPMVYKMDWAAPVVLKGIPEPPRRPRVEEGGFPTPTIQSLHSDLPSSRGSTSDSTSTSAPTTTTTATSIPRDSSKVLPVSDPSPGSRSIDKEYEPLRIPSDVAVMSF
eukprot:PhM_4_TR1042/c0_g1_i1/m.50029